jgi:hypothetical protein
MRRNGRKPLREAEGLFSPAQTRAARGLLGWPLPRLAEAARLEPEAVQLFEAGVAELNEQELQRLAAAIRRAGVMPISAAFAGEGVRFRIASERLSRPYAREAEVLPDWLPLGLDSRGSAKA